MTGKFIIEDKIYKQQKHDHLIIEFNDATKLIYNDVRKFGYICLIKKPLDIFNFNKVGIEPFFSMHFSKELFFKIKRRKASIKNILLDQNLICGIGNIYASEIFI